MNRIIVGYKKRDKYIYKREIKYGLLIPFCVFLVAIGLILWR